MFGPYADWYRADRAENCPETVVTRSKWIVGNTEGERDNEWWSCCLRGLTNVLSSVFTGTATFCGFKYNWKVRESRHNPTVFKAPRCHATLLILHQCCEENLSHPYMGKIVNTFIHNYIHSICFRIGSMKCVKVRSYLGTCVSHCNERNINPVVSNDSIDQQCAVFCHRILTLTETPSLHTEQKHPRESLTPQVSRPGGCNIFHSHSFHVGFKHAISQFNPIFPAFGALQWNRFHLILNIWSSLPLETPRQGGAFIRSC